MTDSILILIDGVLEPVVVFLLKSFVFRSVGCPSCDVIGSFRND